MNCFLTNILLATDGSEATDMCVVTVAESATIANLVCPTPIRFASSSASLWGSFSRHRPDKCV
jgi:hypothetical protein